MSDFALDADTVTALIAAMLALIALFQAFRALRARAIARAAFWSAGAIVAGLIALFFATFQIRLF
jgi:hypothetical protein